MAIGSFLPSHILFSTSLLLLLLPLSLSNQCSADELGEPGCSHIHQDYACLWEQGFIRNSSTRSSKKKTGSASSSCVFMVRDPAFLDVLAFDSKLEFVAHADAHEGGVYFPDDDSFYFATSKEMKPKPNAKIMKVYLETGRVETVKAETEVANGMTLDRMGSLLVLHQGIDAAGGYIERIDLATLESEIVADNWFGHPFNSPNDVVVKTDGSIWFTDPDYGWVQGFKTPPRMSNKVYRISPSGAVGVVAEGFVKPNGLAFSPDERRLYVTDTGTTTGDEEGNVIPTHPHSITVFDVDGAHLRNRRFFASIASLDGSYDGLGCPDGVKVDTMGRVYTANKDGVQADHVVTWRPIASHAVLSEEGKVLGLIRVPGASNMGFAGRDLDELVIMNDTAIVLVHLAARGAGLHYAAPSP